MAGLASLAACCCGPLMAIWERIDFISGRDGVSFSFFVFVAGDLVLMAAFHGWSEIYDQPIP